MIFSGKGIWGDGDIFQKVGRVRFGVRGYEWVNTKAKRQKYRIFLEKIKTAENGVDLKQNRAETAACEKKERGGSSRIGPLRPAPAYAKMSFGGAGFCVYASAFL